MDKEQVPAEQQGVEAVSEQLKEDEIIAEVVKTRGERATVELFVKNTKKKSSEVWDVSNPISAKKGYIVKIAWRTVSKSRDAFMLIMPPILCALAGAIFSYHLADYFHRRKPVAVEDVMLIGVTLWVLPALYYSYRYYRDTYGRGSQPTIIGIIRKD